MTGRVRRVHVLTAHPDPESLTVSLARLVTAELSEAGVEATFENLHESGFDPVFGPGDLATYQAFLHGHVVAPPADVRAQQQILEDADALLIVFPVYWWSVPAQLKGWVDRVMTGGWSWGTTRVGRTASALGHLDVHVLALAGSDAAHYDRHRYTHAIETQIRHGVVEYNQARSWQWTWLWDAATDPHATLRRTTAITESLREAAPVALPAEDLH